MKNSSSILVNENCRNIILNKYICSHYLLYTRPCLGGSKLKKGEKKISWVPKGRKIL